MIGTSGTSQVIIHVECDGITAPPPPPPPPPPEGVATGTAGPDGSMIILLPVQSSSANPPSVIVKVTLVTGMPPITLLQIPTETIDQMSVYVLVTQLANFLRDRLEVS